MDNGLKEVKKYLEKRYSSLKKTEDWKFSERVSAPLIAPVWLWQSTDLTNVSEDSQASGAALFDPEIGLCLFLQEFVHQTDVRAQVLKALRYASKLLPMRNLESQFVDEHGGWRIAMHWLVEKEKLPEWIGQVAEIREDTGHFEEVSIDAIISHKNSWMGACEEHAFPRLLFNVRAIMGKSTRQEVESWQSADKQVRGALEGIEDGFGKKLERDCAKEIRELIHAVDMDPNASRSYQVRELQHLYELKIEKFRNIDRLKLKIRSPSQAVSATIIQGPNGSGKSSIFEAVSIGLAGISERHLRFLSDNTRKTFRRADDYIGQFLVNLDESASKPQLSINSEPLRPISLPNSEEEARIGFRAASGTLFSQEMGNDLLSMSANDVGAEIAASFSVVATEVRERIERRISNATESLKEFNRRWDLRANVRKKSTVIEKIAAGTLRKRLPNHESLKTWLRSECFESAVFGSSFKELYDDWMAIDDQSEVTATEIAASPDVVFVALTLRNHYERIDRLLDRSSNLISTIAERAASLPEGILRDIEKWGLWLERQSEVKEGDKDSRVDAAHERQSALEGELNSIIRLGQSTRRHSEHLENSLQFITEWSEHFDDLCPTCESDVHARGGIKEVSSLVRSKVDTQLENLREQHQSVRSSLDQTLAELSALGAAPPPLSGREIAELMEGLSWIVEVEENLDELLASPDDRERLKDVISRLRATPQVPESLGDLDSFANEDGQTILIAADEHDRVSELPSAWKTVGDEISRRLTLVTNTHLPNTLVALWWEIASNMMPAEWQYPAKPKIQTESKRGDNLGYVVIEGAERVVLANYILNGAEVHNLGLAWFFTKYLIEGRFRNSVLVLDDPAQTMDQPTFRDFCRFLQVLMRLHQALNSELSLLLLVHQDSRALDATRSLDAVFYQLKWNRHTAIIDEPVRLIDDETRYPQPSVMLDIS